MIKLIKATKLNRRNIGRQLLALFTIQGSGVYMYLQQGGVPDTKTYSLGVVKVCRFLKDFGIASSLPEAMQFSDLFVDYL